MCVLSFIQVLKRLRSSSTFADNSNHCPTSESFPSDILMLHLINLSAQIVFILKNSFTKFVIHFNFICKSVALGSVRFLAKNVLGNDLNSKINRHL